MKHKYKRPISTPIEIGTEDVITQSGQMSVSGQDFNWQNTDEYRTNLWGDD